MTSENCRCTFFHGVRRCDRAGLRRDAVYLVRPDGYVATAASERGAEKVASYLDARKLVALSAGPSP